MTEYVIPPVDAGERETSIVWDRRNGNWRCTAEHRWTFDWRLYTEITGLDIGSDYPAVHQDNGHTLRVFREFRCLDATPHQQFGDTTVIVSERGSRGLSLSDIYWFGDAYYDLSWRENIDGGPHDGWIVTDMTSEDSDVDFPRLVGSFFDDLDTFVRKYHHGEIATVPSVESLYERLLEHDSPDDAIPVEAYKDVDYTTTT